MVMNPADRIQTFGSGRIWILPDPEKKTPNIRPDPDPDLVHLYCQYSGG